RVEQGVLVLLEELLAPLVLGGRAAGAPGPDGAAPATGALAPPPSAAPVSLVSSGGAASPAPAPAAAAALSPTTSGR
ncbi:hypothetical protein AB0D83_30505, partial [Streptomyces decoyicus]